ncbi:MAG: hypothetical protein WC749_13935, partial [Dehalococcoidia bacterium]
MVTVKSVKNPAVTLVPVNPKDVIPVTTPESMATAPSRVIFEPASGVIVRLPEVELMSLPFIVILSTDNAVRVPSEVIADCAAPVTVAAEPETLPVTLPVKGPLKAVAATVPATWSLLVEEAVTPIPTIPEAVTESPAVGEVPTCNNAKGAVVPTPRLPPK